MKKRLICLLAWLLITICPVHAAPTTVELSMCGLSSAESIDVVSDILAQLEGMECEVQLLDADEKLSQQTRDIDRAAQSQPDWLIVSAVRAIGLGKAIHRAAEAGVKVILADQLCIDTLPGDVVTCVGVDWEWAGSACADILADYFDGAPARVLEIQGKAGTSKTIDADRGFRNRISECDNLQLAGVLTRVQNRQSAGQALQKFVEQKGLCFDAVFAHGDEQALGAVNALLSLREGGSIPVVCIGGRDDARRAMTAGRLYACVAVDPACGSAIARVIESARAGQTIPPAMLTRGTVEYAEPAEVP